MDELGFFHFPLRGISERALFPNGHEPSGNHGEGMPNLSPRLDAKGKPANEKI
jgi:hypothetical protein